MKKISFALFTLLVIATSCTKKDISISGKLENNKDSIITISGGTGVIKTIPIKEDGSFNSSFKVEKVGIYTFQTSKEKRAPLYLKNGFDISINGDANNFLTSFKYTGTGSSNTQFIIDQLETSKKLGNPTDIFNLDEEAFNAKMSLLKNEFKSTLSSYNDLDSSLVDMSTKQNEQTIGYFRKKYTADKKMGKGKPSPIFENYLNIKGEKKSLSSFKGKYVYIDVWATWCAPCIKEIPALQSLEKKYHRKNIKFVSISVDQASTNSGSWEAAEKKWRDFVKQKQMSGVQLWAGDDTSFQQAYQITGIPRFILIDPQGNIVDANAPRPSDPRLKSLFTSLGL